MRLGLGHVLAEGNDMRTASSEIFPSGARSVSRRAPGARTWNDDGEDHDEREATRFGREGEGSTSFT
jgi:hypothetical protein